MRTYSPAARAYIVAVWLLGLAALVAAFLYHRPDILPTGEVGLACVLAAVAGARKVSLLGSSRFAEAAKISLGFLVTFVALESFGVRGAVLVGAVSGLSATCFPRRQPLHQLLFNVSAIIATAFASGRLFIWLNGRVGGDLTPAMLAALFATALCYFLCNSLLVAGVFGLCAGKRPLEVWRQKFLWTAPSYLAGASCAALGQLLLHGRITMLLLALPVLAFTFQSFKFHADKVEQKEKYIEELEESKQVLADLYQSTVRSLATAIAAKDRYTHNHIQRVQTYAAEVARRMGVEGEDLEAIRTGALLHDIGKLGVPDYVLLKQGPLTPEEFDKMKRHPIVGAAILEPVQFPWPVASVVRHHHERWDGSGYPDGLAREEIPLGARILAVVDVFDALTSDRPYRPAWPRDRALEHLRQEAGSHFDPDVVECFLALAQECEEEEEAVVAAPVAAADHTAAGEIHRRASDHWVLYELGQTLSRNLPLHERLETLARKLTVVVRGATCGFVLDLSDSPAGPAIRTALPDLRVVAAAGPCATALNEQPRLSPESLVARTLLGGDSFVGSLPADEAEQPDEDAPLRAVLMVPLPGATVGGIVLYHPAEGAFDADHESLLQLVANQVAGAVAREKQLESGAASTGTEALTGVYSAHYLQEQTVLGTLARWSSCAVLYLSIEPGAREDVAGGAEKEALARRDVARILSRSVRARDVVARLNGDDFLIVLPDSSMPEAEEVADRLQKLIVGRIAHSGVGSAEVLAGIAATPADGLELQELAAAAERRVLAQKQARCPNRDLSPAQVNLSGAVVSGFRAARAIRAT